MEKWKCLGKVRRSGKSHSQSEKLGMPPEEALKAWGEESSLLLGGHHLWVCGQASSGRLYHTGSRRWAGGEKSKIQGRGEQGHPDSLASLSLSAATSNSDDLQRAMAAASPLPSKFLIQPTLTSIVQARGSEKCYSNLTKLKHYTESQLPYNWIKESNASYCLSKMNSITMHLGYVCIIIFLHLFLLEYCALCLGEMAAVIFIFTPNL